MSESKVELFNRAKQAASDITGKTIRTISEYPRYAIPAATVVVYHDGRDLRILIGKRGPNVALPGLWGIAGGYPDDLQEDGTVVIEQPIDIALRELEQEFLLKLAEARLDIIHADVVEAFLYGEQRLVHNTTYMAVVNDAERAQVGCGEDVDEVMWPTLTELIAMHEAGQIAWWQSYLPAIHIAFARYIKGWYTT